MENKDLYSNYLIKFEEALNTDDFTTIDYLLELIYSLWIKDNDLNKINDALQEITLYSELKESDYKIEALKLIWEFKN